MNPDKDWHENLVGTLCDDYERRIWVSTYERMNRFGQYTDDMIHAADFAVLEYRQRTSGKS
jgi:hypothetical protein